VRPASAERIVEHRFDPFQHGLDILVHVLVGKSDNTIAPLLVEPARALGVVLGLVSMRIAIDLDDEFGGGAEEVDDEAVNRVLAAEVVGGEAAIAKV